MHPRQASIPVAAWRVHSVDMTLTETQSEARGGARLPDALRLGAGHLTVADVDRSVAWYQQAPGLRGHRKDVGVAELGDGQETTVVLHEDAQARPAGRH